MEEEPDEGAAATADRLKEMRQNLRGSKYAKDINQFAHDVGQLASLGEENKQEHPSHWIRPQHIAQPGPQTNPHKLKRVLHPEIRQDEENVGQFSEQHQDDSAHSFQNEEDEDEAPHNQGDGSFDNGDEDGGAFQFK